MATSKGIMNQITSLLVLLTISSLFLPVTAIMYASGSTDTGGGDEATSDTESTDTGGGDEATSDTESTDTGGDMSDTESTDTGNEATSDTGSTAISDILESASIDTGDNTSDTLYMKSNHALDGPPIVTNGTSDSGPMENNATLNPLSSGGPNNMTNSGLRLEGNTTGNSTYPVYNRSRNFDIYNGTGDLASMILAGHNRVRADVGVAPLVWNDSLAPPPRLGLTIWQRKTGFTTTSTPTAPGVRI